MKVLKIIELKDNVQCLLRRSTSDDNNESIIRCSFNQDIGGVFIEASIEPQFKNSEERDEEFESQNKLNQESLQNYWNALKETIESNAN